MLQFLSAAPADGGLGLVVNRDVAIMPDGKPQPNGNRFFASIHDGPRNNQWLMSDKSYFDLNVTLSALAQQPFDRVGAKLINLTNGLNDRAEVIWNAVFSHQWTGQYAGSPQPTYVTSGDEYVTSGDEYVTTPLGLGEQYGVMTLADENLLDWPNNYQFVEALYPAAMEVASPQGPEWFQATDQGASKQTAQGGQRYAGFKITITFRGAVRLTNQADSPP